MPAIVEALAPFRSPLYTVKEPGILDGGDVLLVGTKIFVGLSSRSNQEAIYQLSSFLHLHGYSVYGVHVTGCLHLKTAVTRVAENTLLLNPDWVDRKIFGEDFKFIEVDPSEPFGANAVLVGDKIIYPEGFPKTRKRIEEAGIEAVLVPISELAKAEGAVTCCSLIFKQRKLN